MAITYTQAFTWALRLSPPIDDTGPQPHPLPCCSLPCCSGRGPGVLSLGWVVVWLCRCSAARFRIWRDSPSSGTTAPNLPTTHDSERDGHAKAPKAAADGLRVW